MKTFRKMLALVLALAMCLAMTTVAFADGSEDTSAKSEAAVENEDPSENFNEVGFFESGVDPASRDTYEIVFSYMRPMSLMQQINDVLVEMEPILNFKTTAYCANSDIDALIQNIQLYADQGVDGFIIVIDPTASDRICQVLDETGLPYIDLLNTIHGEDGGVIVPAVGLEGISAGEMIVQWMYDNYKDFWGEIDESSIGLLDFNFSPNTDFNDRYLGAKAKFLELLPDNESMIYDADGVSGKLDEQTGYDLATAILSAHPEVEYWFVPCCLEQYAQGATRAVEALAMEDNVMIVDISGDILPSEWDLGYEGCWVASYAVSGLLYAVPALCAVVSMLDGKSTPETLWLNERGENDLYTNFNPMGEMIVKETYKDYFAMIRELSGLDV